MPIDGLAVAAAEDDGATEATGVSVGAVGGVAPGDSAGFADIVGVGVDFFFL